ncbi:DUF6444 domain-containing protein [Fimbriiglobus ruber]|uniref:DUF6444 domain-containing protein n=1 Tax=Fimbriiglobus ruber TaxID=1908690 RepID=UPI003B846DE1
MTALNAEIAALRAQVAHLSERLGQNSTNSYHPPSFDPPHAKPSPRRTPSGKKRGANPGTPSATGPASVIIVTDAESLRCKVRAVYDRGDRFAVG